MRYGVEVWLETESRWLLIECEDREHSISLARTNAKHQIMLGRRVIVLEDGRRVVAEATA